MADPVEDPLAARRRRAMRDLVLLGLALVVAVVGGLWGLMAAGGLLLRQIPVGMERQFADAVMPQPNARDPVVAELQALADRLAPHMALPAGLTVTVHYEDDATLNAFATLGGHLVFHRGLIEHMPHENALAMVMAHEMAHAQYRDPISGLGGTLAWRLALAILIGDTGGWTGDLLSGAGLLVSNAYSRDVEARADATGLEAVAAHYGHVGGAGELFQVLAAEEARDGLGLPLIGLLSTHPDSGGRIDAIVAMASQRGWPADGPTTPLAPALSAISTADD